MRRNRTVADSQFTILTVDDDPIMTSTIQAYFQRNGYRVDVENDPRRAIERIRKGGYDILLLDFLMTPICGDQVVSEIRKFNQVLFIILLTGHKSMAPPIKSIRELDIQGYYEKSDRFDQLELLVESCVKSIRQMRTIKRYQKELEEGYMETISTQLSVRIGTALGLEEQVLEQLRVAGLFHDIGKIGVPDQVLLKPCRLTEEEYDEIKKHPVTGARILEGITQLRGIVPMVRGHHERYDGSGYPDGLAGAEIPLGARIIAVADAFDAIVSNRQYRRGKSFEEAIEEIGREQGVQFDPQLAELFTDFFRDDVKEQEIRKLYSQRGGMEGE